MDKYVRVEKPKRDDPIQPNEIRVTSQGKTKSYVSYALSLLTDAEKPADAIVFKAMGRAISSVVTVAEVIKRRVAGLHQVTVLDSSDIEDVWEPIEEGLKTVKTIRRVSSISITLSKKPLDAAAPGYQPPLPESEVQPELAIFSGRGRARSRGRGRGIRGGRGGRRGRGGKGQKADQSSSQDAPGAVETEHVQPKHQMDQQQPHALQQDQPDDQHQPGKNGRGGSGGRGRGGRSRGNGEGRGGRGRPRRGRGRGGRGRGNSNGGTGGAQAPIQGPSS